MPSKRARKTTAEAYQVDVQRRLIELLIALAPDAPVPLALLENIISTDSLTNGPTESIADNFALVPSTLEAAVGLVEGVRDIQRNMTRDTLTVSAVSQERLRQQYAQLMPRHRGDNHSAAGVSLTVEMYNAASFLPDAVERDYTHDQLALLVPHLIHLTKAECADPASGWGPVQCMTTLWMLNDHGVVAEKVVAEQTHLIMAYCEPRYQTWDEWLVVSMFTQAVEEMINAGWDEAPTVGQRALEMAEEVVERSDEDDHMHYGEDIAELRQRLAAME